MRALREPRRPRGVPPPRGRTRAPPSVAAAVALCLVALFSAAGLRLPAAGFAAGGRPVAPSLLAAGRRGRRLWRSRRGALAAVDPGDCKEVRGDALSGVTLPAMQGDDPAWLSYMIARYLDDEWVEQDVHQAIGDAVARIYAESRQSGENDLIAVLAKLSYGLKDSWKEAGFEEAFEGPVDVANRAAEFLMLKMGRQVWSYGQSNDEVQEQLLARIAEYEKARNTGASASAKPA